MEKKHSGKLLAAIVEKGEFLSQDRDLLKRVLITHPASDTVDEIIATKHHLLGTQDYEIETLIYETIALRRDCTLLLLLRLYFEGNLSYFNESAPIVWDSPDCLIKRFVKNSTLRQYKTAAMYVCGLEEGVRHKASDLLTDFPHVALPKHEKEALEIVGNNYEHFEGKEMSVLVDAIITIRRREKRTYVHEPLPLSSFMGGRGSR